MALAGMSVPLCRRIFAGGSYEMTIRSEQIVVYGASWCPDARRAKRFFDEQDVAYAWIDIDEDKDASNFVRETNGGQIVIPVILFPDKSILVEPSNYELVKKLEELFGEPDPQS
jgi:mycoredoxin